MVDMVDIRTNDPDINKYSIKFLRGKKMIVTNKRDFKYKIISISRELFHVSARGGQGGGCHVRSDQRWQCLVDVK